jgi:heme-degrading monooxygenase HmoA
LREVATMFARLTTFLGSPEGVDDSMRNARERVVPALEAVDGFRGLMVLVDRASGKQLALTLWESEEALASSETPAGEIRAHSARQSRLDIVDVEQYEVAVDAIGHRPERPA